MLMLTILWFIFLIFYVLFALVLSLYLSLCWVDCTSGLQVAMDMQEEVTARREQVDTLQGKIQHLEEAMDNLYQVENLNWFKKATISPQKKCCLHQEVSSIDIYLSTHLVCEMATGSHSGGPNICNHKQKYMAIQLQKQTGYYNLNLTL